VPYDVDGARFRLFAIQGKDEADVKQMVSRYFATAKVSDPPKAEGTLTLKDPLNAEVDLAWRGKWIWGAVDGASKKRKALVEELGKGLK